MADARALDRVMNERQARTRLRGNGCEHACPARQTVHKNFRVGFQPIHPARVLIQEGKENERAGAETSEMPSARLEEPQNAKAENGRERSQARTEQPDPTSVKRRAPN